MSTAAAPETARVNEFARGAAAVRAAAVPFPVAVAFLGLADTSARRQVHDEEAGGSYLSFGPHRVEVVKVTGRQWRVPVSGLARATGMSVTEVLDVLSGSERKSA